MRKLFFPFFLSLLFCGNVSAQDKKANSDALKSAFLAAQSSSWGTVFTAHKNEVNDSLIDGWREEAIKLYGAEQYDPAHQLVDLCIFLSKTIRNTDLNGKCLLVKAETYYFQSENQKTIELANQAAAAFTLSKNTFQLARSKHRLGLAYLALEDYKKSAAAFEESAALKQKLLATEPENKTYQESLYFTLDKYGDALYLLADYDKEIKVNKDALALSKKRGLKDDEAYQLYCLGWTHAWGKKLYKESIPYFEQSVKAYYEVPDSIFLLYNYKELIKVREQLNDSISAIADADKAVAIALALEDKKRALAIVDGIIQWYSTAQRPIGAIPFYEAKEKQLTMFPDSVRKVKVDMAECYRKAGKFEKSIQTYLGLLAMTTDEGELASTNWSLAIVYEEVKAYQKEIECFRAAIPYYSKQENKHNHIILLNNIGITSQNAGDSIEAYKTYKEAIAITIKYGDPNYPTYAFDKAIESYSYYKDYKRKIETMIMKYSLFMAGGDHEKSGEMAKLIGKEYEGVLKDFVKAEQYFLLCIEHYSKTTNTDALALAYWNYAYNRSENQKVHKEAIDAYKKAIVIYTEQKDTVDIKILLCNVGLTYQVMDDSANAYTFHQKAIDLTLHNADPENLVYAYTKAIDTYSHFNSYKRKRNALFKVYELYLKRGDLRKSGEAAIALGQAFEETPADFDKANQYYQTSIANFTKLNDKSLMGLAYWTQAINLTNNKKSYPSAIAAFDKAVGYYAQLKDTAKWKSVLCDYAYLYSSKGDTTMAAKKFQSAITLTAKNSDRENLVYVYDKMVNYSEKDYRRKRSAMLMKYELFIKMGDMKRSGLQAQVIGKEYQKDPKNYKTVDFYFDRGIKALEKINNRSELGTAYWNKAYNLDENLKRNKEGIENYQVAIGHFKAVHDTANLKSVITNVAMIYREMNDSVNSYKFHQQSIDLTYKYADPLLLAYCYEITAASYAHFKNYGKQKELLLKRLQIYEELKDNNMAGEAAISLGKMYEENIKDYSTAESYYLKGIAYHNLTNNLDRQANALWNYAYNHGQNLRDHQLAIEKYEVAYSLYMQNRDTSNASVMRSNVAQNYWSLEDFDKAILNHKLAIALATKGKNQAMIAKSWNALADLYKKTNNPVDSKEALINAIGALEELKDSVQLAAAYTSVGGSYTKSQDYQKAFEFYDKAAMLHKKLKDTALWASDLYEWALAHQYKMEYATAEEKFNSSMQLYRKINDKFSEVYCLVQLGYIELSVNNDYKKSEPFYNQAVEIAKSLNNEIILAFCYGQMKSLYRNTGRSALADENNMKALEMYKKLKDWKQVANSLSDIAYDAYYVSGDLKKALAYYDEAQVIADTLSDKTSLAVIIQGKAKVYDERGEFTKALEEIDKSYILYEGVQNEWGIASTYNDRGNIYKAISEYETAMKFMNKADSMYKKMGTEYARLVPLANLGGVYSAEGNYQKGLEYSLMSYDIMKKNGDMNANVCIVKGNIGDIYYYLNNYTESDKWLKEALENSRQMDAKRPMVDILSELGRLKIDEKKFDEAERYLNEGLNTSKEIGVPLGYLGNLILMGKLQVELKQYDKAKISLEEAHKICTTIGKDNSLWETLYLLGLMEKNTSNLKQSRDYLKESVKVIEKIRNKVTGGEEAQKLFSSDKNILRVYDALVDVLLALGETEEAMTYLQKNNEDNLKAKIKGLDVKFENENKKRAVVEEKSMKAKLDGIDEQIQKEKSLALEKQNTEKLKNLEGVKNIAESEYLKFVNQQINIQPELSKFFNNSVQPTQFKKIKSKIPKDMALLSYLAGENQLYIFAATSDTVVAKIVTVSRVQLTKDINAMLNIIRNNMGSFGALDLKMEIDERKEIVNTMKQTDPMLKPFEDAFHYLIAPVAREIAGKSRLGVIPTGALNYIPFQMLGKTLANGKFSLMMNEFAIFYANSTDMLFRDDSETDKNYNILAFGNPDKSLPSTEIEVNDIKRMYPNASVFLREEATEDKAKYASETYNVMHFATHGNLDYEDFSKSFLTMAGNPSKSEDGKLTLEELWGMEVMTHLNIVVLSACQTAVTKGSNESSAVSPASGFLQNGVKSVVATLWKVDDEATSLLIGDFYKNIKTMDAVDALRSAQITLSQNKKFSHPYYWAAVVLLGDWR